MSRMEQPDSAHTEQSTLVFTKKAKITYTEQPSMSSEKHLTTPSAGPSIMLSTEEMAQPSTELTAEQPTSLSEEHFTTRFATPSTMMFTEEMVQSSTNQPTMLPADRTTIKLDTEETITIPDTMTSGVPALVNFTNGIPSSGQILETTVFPHVSTKKGINFHNYIYIFHKFSSYIPHLILPHHITSHLISSHYTSSHYTSSRHTLSYTPYLITSHLTHLILPHHTSSSSHHTSSHYTSSHHTSSHYTSSYHTSSHYTSSYYTSSQYTSSYHTSSHCTSSYYTSSHYTFSHHTSSFHFLSYLISSHSISSHLTYPTSSYHTTPYFISSHLVLLPLILLHPMFPKPALFHPFNLVISSAEWIHYRGLCLSVTIYEVFSAVTSARECTRRCEEQNRCGMVQYDDKQRKCWLCQSRKIEGLAKCTGRFDYYVKGKGRSYNIYIYRYYL